MCRARAGQLFGLLQIPTPVFGVDSTPWMGEWVGWWDVAIWDDFSSWTCPYLVGDMDQPLSSWGYGLAPSWSGIWTSPFLVGDMDWPLSSWEYGLAPNFLNNMTKNRAYSAAVRPPSNLYCAT